VDFTRVDGQVHAFEDLFALHAGVQVFDFEKWLVHFDQFDFEPARSCLSLHLVLQLWLHFGQILAREVRDNAPQRGQ
jgi:hypothetical protein